MSAGKRVKRYYTKPKRDSGGFDFRFSNQKGYDAELFTRLRWALGVTKDPWPDKVFTNYLYRAVINRGATSGKKQSWFRIPREDMTSYTFDCLDKFGLPYILHKATQGDSCLVQPTEEQWAKLDTVVNGRIEHQQKIAMYRKLGFDLSKDDERFKSRTGFLKDDRKPTSP